MMAKNDGRVFHHRSCATPNWCGHIFLLALVATNYALCKVRGVFGHILPYFDLIQVLLLQQVYNAIKCIKIPSILSLPMPYMTMQK